MATTKNPKAGASGKKDPARKSSATKTTKRRYPVKFDSSGFKLFFFIGLPMCILGAILVWVSRTVPEGAQVSVSVHNTITRKIVESMPQSTMEWIATVIGAMFVLFGIFCLIMAAKIVVKYYQQKAKEKKEV